MSSVIKNVIGQYAGNCSYTNAMDNLLCGAQYPSELIVGARRLQLQYIALQEVWPRLSSIENKRERLEYFAKKIVSGNIEQQCKKYGVDDAYLNKVQGKLLDGKYKRALIDVVPLSYFAVYLTDQSPLVGALNVVSAFRLLETICSDFQLEANIADKVNSLSPLLSKVPTENKGSSVFRSDLDGRVFYRAVKLEAFRELAIIVHEAYKYLKNAGVDSGLAEDIKVIDKFARELVGKEIKSFLEMIDKQGVKLNDYANGQLRQVGKDLKTEKPEVKNYEVRAAIRKVTNCFEDLYSGDKSLVFKTLQNYKLSTEQDKKAGRA